MAMESPVTMVISAFPFSSKYYSAREYVYKRSLRGLLIGCRRCPEHCGEPKVSMPGLNIKGLSLHLLRKVEKSNWKSMETHGLQPHTDAAPHRLRLPSFGVRRRKEGLGIQEEVALAAHRVDVPGGVF